MSSIQRSSLAAAAALMLSACAMQPLAPTPGIARTQQIAVGQTRADVETAMGRTGRVVIYPFKQEESTQIWCVEDHFVSRCLFVTYDKDQRVKEVALHERERDEREKFGTLLSGSC
ncbi:MAG: hypothetical protein ACRDAM_00955 [Casimicrobium sp.]